MKTQIAQIIDPGELAHAHRKMCEECLRVVTVKRHQPPVQVRHPLPGQMLQRWIGSLTAHHFEVLAIDLGMLLEMDSELRDLIES